MRPKSETPGVAGQASQITQATFESMAEVEAWLWRVIGENSDIAICGAHGGIHE